MSSPIFENLEVPEMIELTAGAKCKKSKSGQRRVKSRETGKCRLPCPTYCRPPLTDEEKADRKIDKVLKRLDAKQEEVDELTKEADALGAFESEAAPAAAASSAAANAFGAGYYQRHRFRGGEFEGGEIEGGVRHKRKMTKYNMFVKKYAAAHRNMSGKSLIRSAAKSWNKCKRSGSRSCSPRRR
jgi:hypothetical protein